MDLGAAWGFAAAVSLGVAWMTRGIAFPAVNSDAEKQVRAGARAGDWGSFSDMHRYAGNKAYMKDVGVLGLAVVQRLLRDAKNPYPLTVLGLVANAVSAVLLFVVARTYWSPEVAWLLFALYLVSFWPLQIVLLGGYQGLAQALLLASVLCLQQAAGGAAWYVGAGAALALMMFTSASARKFLPLFLGAFFFSQRDALVPLGLAPGGWGSLTRGVGLGLIVAIGLLALGVALFRPCSRFLYRVAVTAAYFERAPRWLNRAIGARGRLSLEHYLAQHDRVVRFLTRAGVAIVGYLALCTVLSRAGAFYTAQAWVVLGALLVLVVLTYPDWIAHLKAYLMYWNVASTFGHFRLWADYFARIGRPIPPDMRGGGWPWVGRFFWRIVPFHCVAYGLGLSVLAYALLGDGVRLPRLGADLAVVALSVSPILFGELTRSPQLARAYFPGFIGLLLLVGYAAFRAGQVMDPEADRIGVAVTLSMVAAGAVWNAWVFVTDVWPARMAATWLARRLHALGITRFSTYDTVYNDIFVTNMPPEVRERLDVRFIRTLAEVEEGFVVVPPTSAKAFEMASQRFARTHGNFDLDPLLTRLIESRDIARYAAASFKTFGTSRMWVHESEVMSYRDLILGEITAQDRWRGRAWILDAAKLHASRAAAVPEHVAHRDR